MVIESNSKEETYNAGVQLGQNAAPGQVYCIYGDLGVGKTIISHDEGRLPLYHFDVYRIGDVDEMDEIGYNEMVYGDGVCLIEWANLIEEILPDTYTRIDIEKDLSKGLDYRRITIEERHDQI